MQHIEMAGVWLERGRILPDDQRLMDGPLGLAGQRCLVALFFGAGDKLERGRRQRALDLAHEVITAHAMRCTTGATSPDGPVIMVRVLAPRVAPTMDLLRRIRALWRQRFWNLSAHSPRIWSS